MDKIIQFLCVLLCVRLSISDNRDVYRAGVVELSSRQTAYSQYEKLIKYAGDLDIDILLLPSAQNEPSQFDEIVQLISQAAEKAKTYIVAQALEKVACNNHFGVFSTSMVFDRSGRIVSTHRSPRKSIGKCNFTVDSDDLFSTDFGVTFSHLSERDMVLQNPDTVSRSLKNYLAVGEWISELPFLTSSQFLSSWSLKTRSNLLSSSGIFSKHMNVRKMELPGSSRIFISELQKDPSLNIGPTSTTSSPLQSSISLSHEDLSLYTIRPVDLAASLRGYHETVCHGQFCCEFYVKTSFIGAKPTNISSYSFAVYDGVRTFTSDQSIGVQNCALVACTGLYKRSCVMEFENNDPHVIFDEITVSGNFSEHNSAQFPAALSTDIQPLSSKDFTFDSQTFLNVQKVTLELESKAHVVTFGIFGRDFSKDISVDFVLNENFDVANAIFNYIFDEEMMQFLDTFWFRVKILLFVVSLYILEMM